MKIEDVIWTISCFLNGYKRLFFNSSIVLLLVVYIFEKTTCLKTIGHHTCSCDGGFERVLQDGPFEAIHNTEQNQFQFLGTGYYFWENNIDMAKAWGRIRYGGDYYVLALDFELLEESCFDLVGNRTHQLFLIECIKTLWHKRGVKRNEWNLSECVQFLRKINKLDVRIFPFQLVRTMDLYNHLTSSLQFKLKYLSNKENYTIVNPKIVICSFSKGALLLHTKRIVYNASNANL